MCGRHVSPDTRMPDEKQAFAIWLFHASPRANPEVRSAITASNRDLLEKMTALGGKRYAPYAGVMSPTAWQEHFGPEIWRRLSAAKKKFDPNNVLTPGPNMFG
jgi:FAD/FMN-containing dehydrogenase